MYDSLLNFFIFEVSSIRRKINIFIYLCFHFHYIIDIFIREPQFLILIYQLLKYVDFKKLINLKLIKSFSNFIASMLIVLYILKDVLTVLTDKVVILSLKYYLII